MFVFVLMTKFALTDSIAKKNTIFFTHKHNSLKEHIYTIINYSKHIIILIIITNII